MEGKEESNSQTQEKRISEATKKPVKKTVKDTTGFQETRSQDPVVYSDDGASQKKPASLTPNEKISPDGSVKTVSENNVQHPDIKASDYLGVSGPVIKDEVLIERWQLKN